MTAHPLAPRSAPRVLMTLDAVGGVWRYAMDLALGLKRAGYWLAFVGFGPRPSWAQQREARALGAFDWHDAPLDWTVRAAADLSEVPELIAAAAVRHRVDLVQVNVPSQAAGLKVGVPVIAVSHSCVGTWFRAVRDSDLPPDWAWQGDLTRAGLQAASLAVAPTRAHADLLRRVYPGLGRVEVVHNGSAAPARPASGGHRVVAVGRWWDDAKNGALIDAAAPSVDWPIVLLGAMRGPDGQALEVRNVAAPGQVSHAETQSLLRRAGIFVSPSLYEPFGLAVVEAARAGLPLVLSDIGGFRELWDEAALYVPPDDPTALADALNRLARDEGLRRTMGRAATARSLRYTIEAQTRAMRQLYEDLLVPGGAAPDGHDDHKKLRGRA